jgi:hypothetical protein
MRPVCVLMLSPAGKPVALQVGVPPTSVACNARETVLPSTLLWSPGFVTASAATLQWNVALAECVPSLAVTVTASGVLDAALAGSVPVICPLLLSILTPWGKPVALNVNGAPAVLPLSGRETMSPATLLWSPGLLKPTKATLQWKVTLVLVMSSEAVTVTV